MCRVVALIAMLATITLYGQQPSAPETPPPATPDSLPDAPSQTIQEQHSVVTLAEAYNLEVGTPPPCKVSAWRLVLHTRSATIHPSSPTEPSAVPPQACPNLLNPYARFLDTSIPIPMTPAQKGLLAIHDILDPFNLLTITGSSAVTVAIDPHSPYGPGLKGFGRLTGYTISQDVTGEFFGTFAIPSITHEDPHYHRMPEARFPRRLLHAVSRTVIAQHDDGHSMPNYAALLTYPITAEISNLYVPGIQSNGRSTALRIVTGYALDPVSNIVTEFLPDVAKRIHIRIIFVQQILNQISAVPNTGVP